MPDGDIGEWKQRWGLGAALIDTMAPRRTNPQSIPLRRHRAMDDSALDYATHEGVETTITDLLDEPLAQSIMGRLRDRWALDQTAANDQITGIAYTRQRKAELEKLVGSKHYLVNEYGMRTITDLTPASQRSGMRIDSDMSSPYMRDELDLHASSEKPVESAFRELYTKNKPIDLPDYDQNKVFFVNSDKALEKLTAVGGKDWLAPDGTAVLEGRTATVTKVKDGFYALVIDPPFDVNSGDQITQKKEIAKRGALIGNLLPGTGATPSTYQVVKQLADPPPEPALTDPALRDESIDTSEQLDAIADSKGLASLQGLPQDHPMKTIAAAAEKMVTGLHTALTGMEQNQDALKHNKLVSAALKNIEQLVEAMPSYMDDIPRFSRLFDVLVDEVYLALATAKPYSLENYEKAATKSVERRAPTLETLKTDGVKTETFLVSSGMDTLASATLAAKTALADRGEKVNLMEAMTTKNRKTRGTNYFEVQTNMLGEQALDSTGPLIMGTLNPSTPTQQMSTGAKEEWTVAELIEKLDKRVRDKDAPATPDAPAVAIIDVTVEKGNKEQEDELEQIVKAFQKEIGDGSLQLVLCKSYQKFPSLGSGKAMAGGVSLIGKEGPMRTKLMESLKGTQDSEAVMQNDEAQLVAHFVAHEEDMEQPMLARAAKNAEFVRGLLGEPDDPKFLWAKDLPFVAIPNTEVKFKGDPKDGAINPGELLQKVGVENRFSFGFQNSSCLPFPGGVRIAAGQESEAELIEKFYGPMALIEGKKGTAVTPSAVEDIAGKAANSACKELAGRMGQAREEDASKNAAWRARTVKTLLDAGVLEAEAVEYYDAEPSDLPESNPHSFAKGDVCKVLTADAPDTMDEKLAEILDSLGGDIKENGFRLPEDKALGIQLKLIAQNSGTEIEGGLEQDDVNLLVASKKRGWQQDGMPGVEPQGREAANLPNIIASCALTTDALFKDPDGLASFAKLADLVIDTGLEQLSPEARQKIVRKRAEAALRTGCADVADKEAIDKAVKKIADMAAKLPYREGGANMLKGDDMAATVNGWDKPLTEDAEEALGKIVAAGTSCLDLQSEIDLLLSLLDSVDAQKKIEEGRAAVEETIRQTKEQTGLREISFSEKSQEYSDFKIKVSETDEVTFRQLGQAYGEAQRRLKSVTKGTEEETEARQEVNRLDRLRTKAQLDLAGLKNEIEILRTQITDLLRETAQAEELLKQIDAGTASLRGHTEIAKTLSTQLRTEIDKARENITKGEDAFAQHTGSKPLKALKLGTIPIKGSTATPEMTEKDINALDETLKSAVLRVAEL